MDVHQFIERIERELLIVKEFAKDTDSFDKDEAATGAMERMLQHIIALSFSHDEFKAISTFADFLKRSL